jgi:hydroxyethylthiazole kinase-like sugar kinase family protein
MKLIISQGISLVLMNQNNTVSEMSGMTNTGCLLSYVMAALCRENLLVCDFEI